MDGWPEITKNASIVLQKRYLRKDQDGAVIESPDDMFHRVARNVAAVDASYGDRDPEAEEKEFFAVMRSLDFLPNSPTLMNAGTTLQQLAACFVIPVGDSIEAIFDALKWAAIVHQSGGGTGFSFSQLRPSGDRVASTSGVSSGPISFMRVFDVATDAVRQGGRRRGASMGVLRVDHPDIKAFIHMKSDRTTLSNFNISVAITDEFMEAVQKKGMFPLRNPHTGHEEGSVDAMKLFNEICRAAWETGDPGVMFIDRMEQNNPTPNVGRIETTNPCGEVPLLPFEACNLGSINLAHMVKGPKGRKEVDMERLDRTVDLAIRFLDNVIDAGKYPLPQIDAMVKGNRKIGLGVMGFADLLLSLGVRYGSEGSISLADQIMTAVAEQADRTSRRIALTRGSFPNIEGSRVTGPRRNATLLSIAPTGTISIIAGCSSGIEPHFAFYLQRHVLDGEELVEVNATLTRELQRLDVDIGQVLKALEDGSSLQGMMFVPQELREIFVTAHDVDPLTQVKVQGVFQRHVDNAVSKTINLPSDAGVQDVAEVFQGAYDLRCKGITVYRDTSKPGQVLVAKGKDAECQLCGKTG